MAKKSSNKPEAPTFEIDRNAFLSRLGERLQAAQAGKLPADAGIRDKQDHLERLRDRLEGARKSRDEAVKRFEREIETYRGEITRLEREIYQEQAQLKKAQKGSKKDDDRTTRRVAK